MPLFKRKPFTLADHPKDLEPPELIYQVRFTKEIFRHYEEYLNRINLYRQRVWTCKSTGKTNLTYEEALVSEQHATEKVQELPNEILAPALRTIQFSMLSLRDLADAIVRKLEKPIFVGAELYGIKNDVLYPCRVLKVLEESSEETQYEIRWLDRNRKLREHAILHAEDLVWRKAPFSRNFFKSFIRESTCRSIPWILHEKLAHKHGISTNPPEEWQGRFSFQDGKLVVVKKRKGKSRDGIEELSENGTPKRMKVDGGKPNEDLVKYPIDDLLLQPGPDEPIFTDRPSPSRDFNVPMDCVGDVLMVWDFCSSFGRLLHLSPFSLEEFENAICHKESNLVLIMEIHSALFLCLMKHNGDYSLAVEKRKRKPKISLITWTEYLCDFLEVINIPELCSNITTIKRGHYGLLDANAKIRILRELVNQALETDILREKLDEHIEQRQVLGATRRGEALEEARKRRKEKELLKSEPDGNGLVNGHSLGSSRNNLHVSANDNHATENGDTKEKKNGLIPCPRQSSPLENRSKQLETVSKKTDKKQVIETEAPAESDDSSGNDTVKQLKGDKKNMGGRKTKEQRREYFEREMEKWIISTNPLGKDRDYNRYWWFRRDGRIFVESCDAKQWGYYSSKEELDALMGSLNRKGVRERGLHKQLEKSHDKICMEVQKRSKELAQRGVAGEEAIVRRSTRVRAPPRENPANAFLRYVNKWKED